MEQTARHQCMIYEGSPAGHPPALASSIRQKLNENYRCLYLNSPPMVAGLRSYLFARGVDVPEEVMKRSLILSSGDGHLLNGGFDIDRMLDSLDDAVNQALIEGHQGLWAIGDMSWEFGPNKDFSKLLEYEWGLEELFQRHQALSGVCQYHRDTLPLKNVRQGLLSHRAVFISDTLSRINSHYVRRDCFKSQDTAATAEIDHTMSLLCKEQDQDVG
jgi:hypothetical protein